MDADYSESKQPESEGDEPVEEKKNKTIWIVIAITIIVIFCCCLIGVYGGWWLWNNGDRIFGLASVIHVSQLILS